MRDAHRMKDKLDLSLDSRQVVSLLVAGMVVLGAVFVLGVVVGKKLSETDRAAHSPDFLSALDQEATAMQHETASEEPPLTFQRTLTDPVEPRPVREPAPPATPPSAPASPPTPSPTPAPPATVAVAQTDPAPRGSIPSTPVATRTAPAEERPRTVKLAVPAPRVPAAIPAPTSGWTVQLHASQDRAEADRFAAMMREKGYAPYVVTAEVPGRGTWHRVRMGSFPGRDEAARYLQDFKRETGQDAFLAPAGQ